MNSSGDSHVFKFNMSIYYQSTIIYFVVFVLYVVIKGEFIQGSFTLITKDPVIYFFILVMLIAIATLLYNLFLNRHIQITESEIIFRKRTWERRIKISDLEDIIVTRPKGTMKSSAFRLVKLRIKNKRLALTFRPYDYENQHKLIEMLKEIKTTKLGKHV